MENINIIIDINKLETNTKEKVDEKTSFTTSRLLFDENRIIAAFSPSIDSGLKNATVTSIWLQTP